MNALHRKPRTKLTRFRVVLGALLCGIGYCAAAVHTASGAASRKNSFQTVDANSFDTVVKPMIKSDCIGCHNAEKLKGDLDLEKYLSQSAETALSDRTLWTLVATRVKNGEMPPDGHPKPTGQQVAAVTQWIDQQYAEQDKRTAADPGRLTAHRLNRFEYNNTIRDLLGLNLRFAEDFPPDPYGDGFDNIGDALSLSPVLTEKYLVAAERVAKAAIPLDPPGKLITTRYESETLGQQFHLHVQTVHDFPVTGLYDLRLGWEQGQLAGTLMSGHIYLDGKEVLDQPIVVNPTMDRAVYARHVRVTQGPHLFEVEMQAAPAEQQPHKLLGPPYPTVMEVTGPFEQQPREQTESYKLIFFKGSPAKQNKDQYRREILARLARHAYRRPIKTIEVNQLVSLARLVESNGGTFEGGVQVALEAILMSPNFLFRIEHDPPQEMVHRVSDVELASRLSYFLWSSMPDEELLSTAEAERLHDPATLHAQVRRMLADPKAHTLATNFASQWLETRNLNFNKPDAKTFLDYDPQLRDAMQKETEMFFQAVVDEDRSVLDFLDGDFTFVNERLAHLYGISGVQGREFRRVKLDGTNRSGIITQASVLTASSYPTRTSPVIRGKWVLSNILNTPPPAPPPNVPALEQQPGGDLVSVRQKLEAHRANPACAGCHARMDPLGFSLENYDAIGRWRNDENSLPIDASGVLPNGSTVNGAAGLKAVLKANAPQFADALTAKLLTYALGRGLEPSDQPAVKKIALRIEKHDYRFSELIDGIVDSEPFQMGHREVIKPTTSVKSAALDPHAGDAVHRRTRFETPIP